MRIIYPTVLLAALLSITGVQGQACADPFVVGSEILDTGTIYDLLCGTGTPFTDGPAVPPQFTIFCTALDIPKLAQTKLLLQSIATGTEFTVFAPVDAAFDRITAEALDNLILEQDELARIIELHISEGRFQTTELGCNTELCAINTQAGIDGIPRTCVQQSRTKCTTAGMSFQIGPGNRGGPLGDDWPKIGSPINLFDRKSFTSNPELLSSEDGLFSSNINVCNGVVQVVDQFLRPGFINNRSKSGKGGKGFKGYYNDSKSSKMFKGGRALDQDMINEKDEDNSSHDRRRRLLESLVEPNGNIEQLD